MVQLGKAQVAFSLELDAWFVVLEVLVAVVQALVIPPGLRPHLGAVSFDDVQLDYVVELLTVLVSAYLESAVDAVALAVAVVVVAAGGAG